MEILVDTHVHIYPCYDLQLLFDSAFRNFSALGAGVETVKVLMLTERWDCNAFEGLSRDRQAVGGGFSVDKTADSDALLVRNSNGQEIVLVAGRQLVTAERLEVLLLGRQLLPISEAIVQGAALGAVPVLNWSLGKWWFKRGEAISQLLEQLSPEAVLLGDVLARPKGLPLPKQFARGGGRGFRFVAGSDPLPVAGEEKLVARFATRLTARSTGSYDGSRPASSLRKLLMAQDTVFSPVGSRSDLFSAGRRLVQNELARRRGV